MKPPIVSLEGATVVFRHFDTAGRSFKHRLAMLSFPGLHRGANSSAESVSANQVLRNVDLDIDTGARIAVLGRNASGKTSLMRMVGGLVAPVRGKITRNGDAAIAMEIGVGVDLKLSVADTIRLQAILWYLTSVESEIFYRETVEIGELESFQSHTLQTLPPGYASRLAVAMTIASQAPLLLFDEVFEHVDPAFTEKISALLRTDAHADRALMLVARQKSLLEALCDRSIVLERGEVIHRGPLDEVLSEHWDLYVP